MKGSRRWRARMTTTKMMTEVRSGRRGWKRAAEAKRGGRGGGEEGEGEEGEEAEATRQRRRGRGEEGGGAHSARAESRSVGIVRGRRRERWCGRGGFQLGPLTRRAATPSGRHGRCDMEGCVCIGPGAHEPRRRAGGQEDGTAGAAVGDATVGDAAVGAAAAAGALADATARAAAARAATARRMAAGWAVAKAAAAAAVWTLTCMAIGSEGGGGPCGATAYGPGGV